LTPHEVAFIYSPFNSTPISWCFATYHQVIIIYVIQFSKFAILKMQRDTSNTIQWFNTIINQSYNCVYIVLQLNTYIGILLVTVVVQTLSPTEISLIASELTFRVSIKVISGYSIYDLLRMDTLAFLNYLTN